jgi:lipoyl(octanoyl) transferase
LNNLHSPTVTHWTKHVNSSTKPCWVVDLGLISYSAALEWQQRAVAARKRGEISDLLLLCEHPHVITLGRNGKTTNLRASDRLLAQMNVEFHESDRGGDITYHGPGQIVGYPIVDLTEHRRDVRWYVQNLEEVMIRTSAEFGVDARRAEGRHGLWVDGPKGREGDDQEEKLAAIGVHLSRWVTSHGFAYNVSTDLRYFDLIVPCGIPGKRATSLERLLGHGVPLDEVRTKLTTHFGNCFDHEIIPMPHGQLMALLERPATRDTASVEILPEAEQVSAGASSGI